jgi:hypothetical protein
LVEPVADDIRVRPAAKSEGKISADNERTLMSIKGDERVPAHF